MSRIAGRYSVRGWVGCTVEVLPGVKVGLADASRLAGVGLAVGEFAGAVVDSPVGVAEKVGPMLLVGVVVCVEPVGVLVGGEAVALLVDVAVAVFVGVVVGVAVSVVVGVIVAGSGVAVGTGAKTSIRLFDRSAT